MACLEAAAGDAAQALKLLTVADRHRALGGTPVYAADEKADHDAARKSSHEVLGPAADAITEAAGQLPLDEVVDQLLEQGPAQT